MAHIACQTVFAGASLIWQGVHARFNARRKDGSWQGVWLRLLRENGAHLDIHLLNALFGEICASLEAANIPVVELFLNADKAFDTKDFCQECARHYIMANIPRNRRAADWQTDNDTPFDPELYARPRRGRTRQRLTRRL